MNSERVGSAQLRSLDLRLSARDRLILQSLDEHRFLLTSHLQRLHFADHVSASAGIRACVRALDRLLRLRLITRLTRQIGGHDAGSRGYVWCLDSVGDRLLRPRSEEPARRKRFLEPSLLFLEHTLAVADIRIRMEEAARAGRFELDRTQTEPTVWRHYTDQYGRPAVLKPDLGAVTATGDYEDHWFIEVDRGTESIRTLLAKCAQYETYRATGKEQAVSKVFPIVLWLVPDEGRRDRLRSEITTSRTLDPAPFWVALPDQLEAIITGSSEPKDATTSQATSHILKGGTHA